MSPSHLTKKELEAIEYWLVRREDVCSTVRVGVFINSIDSDVIRGANLLYQLLREEVRREIECA